MLNNSRTLLITACLALASLVLSTSRAEAQAYSTPQATAQLYQAASCYCPFPQGYCPFPGGYCALPAGYCGTPLCSPQGGGASGQAPMMTPQYSYQGYSSKPYPTPTIFTPRPIGIPTGSMPTGQGQGQVWPNSQVASAKK